MFAGTGAYSKVEQEERYEPSSPGSYLDPRQVERRRPWSRVIEPVGKVIICLLAVYGLYSAVANTVALTQQSEHHHHHDVGESINESDAHHPAHNEAAHNDAAHQPILHDDGYMKYPDWKSCSCGATVEEALAMGCKYDSHALAWLPAHCRDDELTAEFETLGPGPGGSWELYADAEGKHPLNMSEISMFPGTKFFMTMEWHDMHCAYTWRKLYRSRWLGITMDRKSDGLGHIGHCTGEFLRRAPLQALTTRATIDLDAENPAKED